MIMLGRMRAVGVAITLAAVVTWLALSAASTGSPAQEADRAELAEEFQQRLKEARTRLNLTGEQVERVRPILRASAEGLLEVLEEHGVDLRDRSGPAGRLRLLQLRRLQRDLDAVRRRTVKALDDVLTDAQLEAYQEIQEENRQSMRERLRQRR